MKGKASGITRTEPGRRKQGRPAKKRSPLPWLVAGVGGVGVVFLVLLLVFLLRSRDQHGAPKPMPVALEVDRTAIQGNQRDPEFSDRAPEGGLLVGFAFGLGKFGSNDTVTAVRPIFRVGNQESLGKQQGTESSRVVKVLAKPGYAVGAITVKSFLAIDGVSVTFMKDAQGRLDPNDAYESNWIGGMGGIQPVRLSGEGSLVIGLIGRANKKDITGLGLLLLRPAPGNPSEKK